MEAAPPRRNFAAVPRGRSARTIAERSNPARLEFAKTTAYPYSSGPDFAEQRRRFQLCNARGDAREPASRNPPRLGTSDGKPHALPFQIARRLFHLRGK